MNATTDIFLSSSPLNQKLTKRRSYGKHFNFETGIGIGEVFYFGKNAENLSKNEDVTLDLHLRIGYKF